MQYSFEETEPYYLTTGFRVTVTHQLGESFHVRGAAGLDRLEYREEAIAGVPSDRHDRLNVFGAGMGYRFQANLRMGVDAEFGKAPVRFPIVSTDRTRLLGSASYGF